MSEDKFEKLPGKESTDQVVENPASPYQEPHQAVLEMAERAKEKRAEGKELSVDEGASISYAQGSGFEFRAARSHFFGD